MGPVLYWNLKMEGYVEDGSKYQATPWRTIPDYQGGERAGNSPYDLLYWTDSVQGSCWTGECTKPPA